MRRAVRSAVALGVRYLTLFGFSSENWRRPVLEINDLMGLLRFYLRHEVEELDKEGVQLRIIGDRERLADDIITLIEHSEMRTQANTRLTLTVALSYGGRQEIVRAARLLVEKTAAGQVQLKDITDSFFAAHLFTHGMPDPDLLIRTSGEKRISNFLLWQLAYAELIFIDTLWPDFSHADLEHAISEFHRRERRYGAVTG
ncbi:MAG: uppS [Rhodospirillaceae bacterium]|nr:MAG: uppS [Rhodospirillaceae bacterium]